MSPAMCAMTPDTRMEATGPLALIKDTEILEIRGMCLQMYANQPLPLWTWSRARGAHSGRPHSPHPRAMSGHLYVARAIIPCLFPSSLFGNPRCQLTFIKHLLCQSAGLGHGLQREECANQSSPGLREPLVCGHRRSSRGPSPWVEAGRGGGPGASQPLQSPGKTRPPHWRAGRLGAGGSLAGHRERGKGLRA